jgi:hypothetical protein
VVTEYGIADLRGRTDREVAEALLGVMDARFQDEFVDAAKRARKLPRDFRVPDLARANRPEVLRTKFGPWCAQGHFPELPFGSDFTQEERVLAKTLRSMEASAHTFGGRLGLLWDALVHGAASAEIEPYLSRMSLANPKSSREWLYRRALAVALKRQLRASQPYAG